jgi:hypothetical protein
MECWALGTLLGKYALNGSTPVTLLPLQLVVSVAFLAVVLAISAATRAVHGGACLL